MKYYETTFEEYLNASNELNLHPEINTSFFSKENKFFYNSIFFGPSGVGKYTQVLKMIAPFSPTHLKYEKKMKFQNEKIEIKYCISDIHYEIDLALLGCNSKTIWNELFMQIIDVISVKPDKKGFIVCKNFHSIHNELLEVFYTYMQQYNHVHSIIQIRFVLITEQICFIPNNIINICNLTTVKTPSSDMINKMLLRKRIDGDIMDYFIPLKNEKKEEFHNSNTCSLLENEDKLDIIVSTNQSKKNNTMKKTNTIAKHEPTIKGRYFQFHQNIKQNTESTIFEVICNAIIHEMIHYDKIKIASFRDIIYDILIYNLDIYECIWYIFYYFIFNDVISLSETQINKILDKTFTFFKYYNNNYRPIYHIENILFYMIQIIHF